ncbi:unnamed protein product [Camellia sinensis]
MVATTKTSIQADMETNYDRAQELKAFGDTKTGVKGLVDAGIAGTLLSSTKIRSGGGRSSMKSARLRRIGGSSRW